jgi:hypothetical protein
MAYDADNLNKIAFGGDGASIYNYASEDSIATVLGTSYFDDATTLNSGDIIIVTDEDGKTYEFVASVNSSTGVVTLEAASAQYVDVKMTDISTAQTIYTTMPAGIVTEVKAVINGQVTVANCGLTIRKGTDSLGTMTVTTAQTAGQEYTVNPTSNNTFDGSTPLNIVSDGASTTAVDMQFRIKVIAAAQ